MINMIKSGRLRFIGVLRYLLATAIMLPLFSLLIQPLTPAVAENIHIAPSRQRVPPGRMRIYQELIAPATDEVAIGDEMTFRITVRNVGVVPLSYIWIRDQFPRDAWQYVSASPQAMKDSAGYYAWHGVPLPTKGLQPSASVSVEITFRVLTSSPNAINHAFVSAWTAENAKVPSAYVQLPVHIVARDLYCARGWPDYAPVGMPDIGQKQAGWQNPTTQQWSYAGPVALANVLWWLDSGRESSPSTPPAEQDSYDLVTAFGPWDDHDPRNVPGLVQALAEMADTDGQRTGGAHIGTTALDLYNSALQWMIERSLSDNYDIQLVQAPQQSWLQHAAWQCDGLTLLLGVWENQSGQWQRIGGHYVTVACVSRWTETTPLIELADPLANRAESGWPGQYNPGLDHQHPTQGTDTIHNDANYVSWDLYSLDNALAPGGQVAIRGYQLDQREINELAGQNIPDALADYQAQTYHGGAIQIVIEYALRIRDITEPRLCPQPPVTPIPTPTATPELEIKTVTMQQGLDGYTKVDDTYLSLWAPTTNYGRASFLQVRSESYMRPLLRFDLEPIPSHATILKATLTLRAESGGWYEQDISIFQILRPWNAQQATWNQATAQEKWGLAGCDQAGVDRSALPIDTTLAIAGAEIAFDVTDLVASWVERPAENHGLLLQGMGQIAVQHSLTSSEHWYAALRPRLTVLYGVLANQP